MRINYLNTFLEPLTCECMKKKTDAGQSIIPVDTELHPAVCQGNILYKILLTLDRVVAVLCQLYTTIIIITAINANPEGRITS